MENLLKFITEHADDDVSRLILDRMKHPDIDMECAVNSIESRRKLKGKVQEWYNEPRLLFPLKLSAEQCSSSATGKYKAELAERIASESPDQHKSVRNTNRKWILADLTGGLGVDSWFFSQRAGTVFYNEMQEVLCKAAAHNFKVLGADNIVISNTKVESGKCLDFIPYETQVDIVYADPARRSESGKKVFLIEDCTPDVLTLKEEIFCRCRHFLIKLSPMADISMVCDRLGKTCREIHVVASGGECKELLIWMDREWNDEYTVMATELQRDGSARSFTLKQSEEKTAIYSPISEEDTKERYLFEPGKSLMKAGAFNLIAQRFGIKKLGRSTHYYLTDSKEKAEMLKQHGKVFSIIESLALDKRSIKETGKKYPKAEVTARNIPMDTDALRKKLGVSSGDDIHIFGLKADLSGNLLLVTERF